MRNEFLVSAFEECYRAEWSSIFREQIHSFLFLV